MNARTTDWWRRLEIAFSSSFLARSSAYSIPSDQSAQLSPNLSRNPTENGRARARWLQGKRFLTHSKPLKNQTRPPTFHIVQKQGKCTSQPWSRDCNLHETSRAFPHLIHMFLHLRPRHALAHKQLTVIKSKCWSTAKLAKTENFRARESKEMHQTEERILQLHRLYKSGEIPGPNIHEVHPELPLGSIGNYLYFTLSASLNFQRNSPALWASALRTYDCPETSYVFSPEKVCSVPFEKLQRDLLRFRLALQTNRHPVGWLRLCTTLAEEYECDPRNILKEGNFDVPTIIDNLQRSKSQKFPFLSGLKLSNYWLFILLEFTDVCLSNTAELSIIPDTHVIRSSAKLGVVPPDSDAATVDSAWRVLLRSLGLSPVEMHSALWRWSRSGFAVEI